MNWEQWLHEEVETPYGGCPRHMMLHTFVKDGLYPFIQHHGYSWATGVGSVQSSLATGLYRNIDKSALCSDWTMLPNHNTDYLEEDIQHFQSILSQDIWDSFWENWGHWSDVSSEEWRGQDRRLDIQTWVWTQIHLENSKQTKILNEILDFPSDDDDTRHRRNEDIYLREAAESNEWGGYRR